jgi:L,D-transpeptidase YbiS
MMARKDRIVEVDVPTQMLILREGEAVIMPTGEVYSAQLRALHPQRDWILTRILWLSGLEPGRNRLGQVDTMRRYIYIHGCPDEDPMGIPSSHGCVKMRNTDMVALFEQVDAGTRVHIVGGE